MISDFLGETDKVIYSPQSLLAIIVLSVNAKPKSSEKSLPLMVYTNNCLTKAHYLHNATTKFQQAKKVPYFNNGMLYFIDPAWLKDSPTTKLAQVNDLFTVRLLNKEETNNLSHNIYKRDVSQYKEKAIMLPRIVTTKGFTLLKEESLSLANRIFILLPDFAIVTSSQGFANKFGLVLFYHKELQQIKLKLLDGTILTRNIGDDPSYQLIAINLLTNHVTIRAKYNETAYLDYASLVTSLFGSEVLSKVANFFNAHNCSTIINAAAISKVCLQNMPLLLTNTPC
jgi:hypothetical protein